MDNPLISVIVPIYNADKYLSKTLESIVNQTYKNLEILLINHHSTDLSAGIIDDFLHRDDRIHTYTLDINKGGPAYPRNVGIEKSKGCYIAFLDSDDVWFSDKLEKQILFLKENECNFTSSDRILVDGKDIPIRQSLKGKLFNRTFSKKNAGDLIKNSFIVTSSVLIKKELLSKFSEEKNSIAVEDFKQWLNVLALDSTNYKYQNDKLLKYRVLEESATNRSQLIRQELKANIIIANFLLENEKYTRYWYHRLFFHLFRKQIKLYIKKIISNKT